MLIILALVVGIVVGFSKENNRTTGTIKIGAALSMTGDAASFGEKIKNAVDMAIEEVNNEYDFDLEVVYEDTRSEVEGAVSAVRKLVDIDKVKIILGPVRSNNVLAVAPITEENKVILFTPISSAEDITHAGDYVFRNRETAGLHGIRIAEFLNEQDIKKLTVFTANSANSRGYSGFLIPRFEELGGEITFSVEYDENMTDFRTDIAKAKNSGAQAIYVASALGNDGGLLAKQLREQGFEGNITGSVGIESDEFLEAAGTAANGVVYSSPAFDPENPMSEEYLSKYRSRYGSEGDAFSANAYDAVQIIALAIESCEDTNVDCIRDYLYNVRQYPGVGGLTSFDENGDVIKPVLIKTIRDGAFVLYEN